MLVSGYAYSENGVQQVRYRDVWRSDFSVESSAQLAARCGGVTLPTGDIGLRLWPGRPVVPSGTMTFSSLTLRAPWSPRFRPGLLLMNTPVTYTTVEGKKASTGPDWLLLYEGMGVVWNVLALNENDVYASVDNGATWNLISGVARRGVMGNVDSAYAGSSFAGSILSANCEDPLSDDVYTIAGTRFNTSIPPGGAFSGTNEVWYSSNALVWTRRTGRTIDPPRTGAACDVGHTHNLIVVAGQSFYPGGPANTYLNDVWTSTNKGVGWSRTLTKAPFPGRSRHTMQITPSEVYNVDLIFVAGGQTYANGMVDSLNDVWVSSNGGTNWLQVTGRAGWMKRWGHTIVITSAGAMVLAGSNNGSDVWASFNGGRKWSQCKLQAGQTVTENSPAVALTKDEKLVVGSGYPRTDLWISDVSFSDTSRLSTMCVGSIP